LMPFYFRKECPLNSGYLKCSECGATIVLGGYALKRFGMYRCPNRSANRCSAKAISRKQTDATILYMLALCDRFETENSEPPRVSWRVFYL
ncbi:hypothetical protein UL73_24255, partial [Shigella flexneri]